MKIDRHDQTLAISYPRGESETSCEYTSGEVRPKPAGRSQIYVPMQYVKDLSYGFPSQR